MFLILRGYDNTKYHIMNKFIIFYLILVFSTLTFYSYGQKKIAIADDVVILSEITDSLLTIRLQQKNLIYDNIIDYSDKCSHYYADIFSKNDLIYLNIKDCKDEQIGFECLGSNLENMDNELKSFILCFYINTIINGEARKEGVEPEMTKNEHDSRYFFSPSSFNLKKGELYYNSIYFAIHDIQYGFSDNFSIGMGTSVAGIPIYFTPKFSMKLNEKNRLAVGNMLILGTYGPKFTANLAYTTYTYGSSENNLSLSAGHFYTGNNDLADEIISQPIFNISAMFQLKNNVYFTTENYYLHNNTTLTAEKYDNNGNRIYEDYTLSDNFIFGFSGFRIINKSKDVISWQFGLAYFIRFMEDMPYKYSTGGWDGDYPGNTNFPIPTISYTQKFGKKY